MKQVTEDFHCIAIDMGAGSIRVMLGTISGERISYREIHRIENRTIFWQGRERWEMERIIREIRAGIRRSMHNVSDIPVSIGVDSWGVDFVHLGSKGELIEPPVAYRDSRTEGMRERWAEMMPEMETFSRTGINFYLFNTLFQLLSIKDSDLLKNTGRILFLPCYVNYLLSGMAANEVTIASTSQMLSLHGDDWDGDILGRLGLKRELLGDVVTPGTILGKVILPEADSVQLQNVAVCGHDTACVVAAIPADRRDFAYISAGTWCIVGIESDTPLVSEKSLKLGFTNEKGYNGTFRTLKNIVGLWLLQGLKKKLPPGTSYSAMEQMTLDGGETLQVIDPDDAGFYNPGDMQEAFDTCLSKSNQPLPGSFSDYLRCAYDSICFSIRYHIEKLELLSGRRISVLHLVGGGSQSAYLNQRIATLCERTVISGPVEGAVLGNILVQAIAMGRIVDMAEGRSLVKDSSRLVHYEPGTGEPALEERYQLFLRLKHT